MLHIPVRRPLGQLWWFFAIALAIMYGLAVAVAFFAEPLRPFIGNFSTVHPIFYVAVSAPAIAALILTARDEGWQGAVQLGKTYFTWQVPWKWYLVPFLLIPLLDQVGAGLESLRTDVPLRFVLLEYGPVVALLPLTLFVDGGPLGEELGWHGYALPRLLERFNPFAASLVLGVPWVVWHLPAFFVQNTAQVGRSFFALALGVLGLSFIMTWVYLNTKSVLVSAVLPHLMFNVTVTSFNYGGPVVFCAGVVIILLTRQWRPHAAVPAHAKVSGAGPSGKPG